MCCGSDIRTVLLGAGHSQAPSTPGWFAKASVRVQRFSLSINQSSHIERCLCLSDALSLLPAVLSSAGGPNDWNGSRGGTHRPPGGRGLKPGNLSHTYTNGGGGGGGEQDLPACLGLTPQDPKNPAR